MKGKTMTVKRFLQTLRIGYSGIRRVQICERDQIIEKVFDDQIKKGEYGENEDRAIIRWDVIGKRIDIEICPAEWEALL